LTIPNHDSATEAVELQNCDPGSHSGIYPNLMNLLGCINSMRAFITPMQLGPRWPYTDCTPCRNVSFFSEKHCWWSSRTWSDRL